jgi:hypothetical protein
LPWAAVEFEWVAEFVDAAESMPGTAAAPCTDPAMLPWGAAELAWVAAFACGAEPAGAAAPFPWIAPPAGVPTARDVPGVPAGDAAGDAVAAGVRVALGVGVVARDGESAGIMPGTDACPADGCDPDG